MITGISIENFKGIGDRVEIELHPITLLFGANSAGKSTILHALHYAREVFERRNYDADRTIGGGEYIDLGGFRNFVHNRELDRQVKLGFRIDFSEHGSSFFDHRDLETVGEYLQLDDPNALDRLGAFTDAFVSVSIAWSEKNQRPYAAEFSIEAEGETFAVIRSDPDAWRILLEINSSHASLLCPSDVSELDEEDFEVKTSPIDDQPEPTILEMCLPAFAGAYRTTDDGNFFLRGYDDYYFAEERGFFGRGQRDALPDLTREILPFAFAMKEDQPLVGEFDDPSDAGRFTASLAWGISQLIVIPLQEVSEFVTRLRYLGPLRETPPRHYSPPRFPDPSRWASGLGAWDFLLTASDDDIEDVSRWLGDTDCLNCGYHIQRKRIKELDLASPLIRELLTGRAFDDAEQGARVDLAAIPTEERLTIAATTGNVEFRPHDIGVGISQVIPVVVTALNDTNRPLCIEQPELHLHPRLQAELGDLFIHAAKGEASHTFILETHSELIPLRIMRRIRETEAGTLPPHLPSVSSADVAIYYVELTDGSTSLQQLELSEEGKLLDPWPNGFFEEGFRERFSE